MNDQTEAPRLPALQSGGSVKAIVPQDFDGAWRIANVVVKSGMAPKGIDTAEMAMVAIMHGMEVGFTPMAALQSISVINGRPTIWGDGALGLVQSSGLMESFDEAIDGEGEARKATCTVKRKGDAKPKVGKFSVADAKKANLWGKSGPWQTYPDRMLQMRARGFALRDGFADVLRGLGIAEEVRDTPAMHDITPPPPPPPPPVDAKPEAKPEAKAPPPPPVVTNKVEVKIIDHEVEVKTQAPADEIDATQFFEDLEADLARAETVEDIEEAWTFRDPLAVFDDDVNQGIALAIKNRRLRELV
jgi:hypothetical protein